VNRLALLLIVVGCTKADSKQAAVTSPPAAPPPVAAAPPAAPIVDGVLVTAGDVLVNGKSLVRVTTEHAALVAVFNELHNAHPKAPLAVTYTEDASAVTVLDALHAIGEATTAPKPADAPNPGEDPQLARQRAIDEARTAGALGTLEQGATPYTLSVLAGGAPQKVCDARAVVASPDDERVDLALTVGAGAWTIAMTRVNEIEKPDSIAKLADMLKRHKESAFFVDRTDVELAAEAGAHGADLTPVIAASCAVGFFQIRPVSVEEVAKQLEPRAPVPTVSVGQPNAQGELDKAIIRRYIKRNIQKLEGCYEHELVTKPKLRGTVMAQFAIGPDGRVTVSDASGVDPAVAKCVAGVIKQIEFPKPKKGVVQVNYPFTFRAPDLPAAKP
jgi:hypothetical protein